jgi:hypothetical protein
VAQVRVPGSVDRVLDSVLRVPVVLEQVPLVRHLRVKLLALRVLPVRREAVAVSNIQRLKKAR